MSFRIGHNLPRPRGIINIITGGKCAMRLRKPDLPGEIIILIVLLIIVAGTKLGMWVLKFLK